jgi:hypothetical protein
MKYLNNEHFATLNVIDSVYFMTRKRIPANRGNQSDQDRVFSASLTSIQFCIFYVPV